MEVYAKLRPVGYEGGERAGGLPKAGAVIRLQTSNVGNTSRPFVYTSVIIKKSNSKRCH